MSEFHEHIVKSIDEEQRRLVGELVRMGGLAAAQLEAALDVVERRDDKAAARIIEDDEAIDALEHETGHEVMRLALRGPMARDLRELLAALRIASDIERIGDYAKNIAKRALQLNQLGPLRPVSSIPRMGRLAQQIVKDVLDAYVEKDAALALAAWRRDEEIDDLYTSLFRELLTYMMEDPRNIGPSTHLLFIAKNIERIGDHANNIAETVHFLALGRTIDETRPKGDTTNVALDG